jgi:DnaJ-class molecular chaperone
MTPQRAREILPDVAAGDHFALVKAVARAARRCHPDTNGGVDAPFTLQDIKDARETLLNLTKHPNGPCSLCSGRGYILGCACVACGGTGAK